MSQEFCFLDKKPADIAIYNRSIQFGEGVFETFRYKQGLPVYFDRHMKRMEKGALALELEYPGPETITGHIIAAIQASGIKDAYVKVSLLSEGENTYYGNSLKTHILIIIRGYKEQKPEKSVAISTVRRYSGSPTARIKTLNYLESIVARRKAIKSGYEEAILLNEKDELCEGSSCNIFFYSEGVLYTPSVACGILPGITRGIMIETALEEGIEFREGSFTVEELDAAECILLTNSLIGVNTVSNLEAIRFAPPPKELSDLCEKLFEKLKWNK